MNKSIVIKALLIEKLLLYAVYYLGTSHADDVSYFARYLSKGSQETETDKAMTKFMSAIFINFMKTG